MPMPGVVGGLGRGRLPCQPSLDPGRNSVTLWWHFLAANPDVSAMGLELNHLLPGETRNDLEDFAVVVDDPEHGVVQLCGDDLVGMDDSYLDALAG